VDLDLLAHQGAAGPDVEAQAKGVAIVGAMLRAQSLSTLACAT
jgi:hypothetical protein